MATIAFYYPTQAGATVSWVPAQNVAAAFAQPRQPGVLAKVMADRTTIVSYQQAPVVEVYDFVVRYLTTTDRDALNTFVGTVLGKTFELVHPVGGGLVTVRFDREFLAEMRWEYDDETYNEPWSLPILLRKAA